MIKQNYTPLLRIHTNATILINDDVRGGACVHMYVCVCKRSMIVIKTNFSDHTQTPFWHIVNESVQLIFTIILVSMMLKCQCVCG